MPLRIKQLRGKDIMLKNLSRLEHKVGDRAYHLLAESDSPLNEVKEALFEFLKFIGKVEDDVRAKLAAEAAVKVEEKSVEAVEEVKVSKLEELEPPEVVD